MPVSFTLNRVTSFRPLTGDQDGDGFADAGDVLRHTLTIHNTGDTDALNVVLNDLLGGSTETGLMNISPIAFNDAFTAVGNTALRVGGAANIGTGPSSIVAGNLLDNDVGSTTVGVGALAADDVTGFTIDTVTNGLTTLGGTFSIFADGSFNYISQAGDQGVDTFTYTIRDAGINGIAGDADDTTSTATVSITITGQVWYVDSAASAVGADGTSAHPFTTITALQAANVDGANDYVYVKGNATGQLVMETGEHLIGQGADLDVAGFHLADDGARSTMTNNAAGFGVTLAGGGTGNNEIAGINLVSTGGAGNHGLTGTSFGNLTINNTTVDASGQGVILSTGAIVAGSTGLVSTDSDGGANNVSLTGITGTLALGTGALSGATGTAFNVSGGSVTTTYSGNVSQATVGQALLSVAGGHSGTLTFSTGTLSASNGTGLQFDNADGTYNLNGNNTLNGGDAGIDILNGSTGTFSFSSNSSIINPSGTGFNLSSSNANVTYSGSISDTTGKAVVIDNHDSGTITFQTGSITSTGTGLTVSNSNGGTINFNGQTTLTTTTSTAVDLATNNGGGTIVFNAAGNGLDITTTTGAGFLASGGGTLTVLGAGNTIVSGSGTAFNASGGTTIAAAGVTFASISSNGSVNGIVLNGTGSTGFFTVTGDGSQTSGLFDRDGSGGTIQNTTQDAISLTNAFNVTLRQMNITNAGWDGVGSVGGGNILLRAMDINHPGNANPASDGSTGNTSGFGGGNGWYAQNITGVNSFDNNSRVFNWQSSQSNGVVVNSSNTNYTSFTVDNAFFSTSATGAAGFNVSMNGTSSGIATLTDTDLTLIDQNGAQFLNNGSGTLTAIVQRNNFHDADATGGDGNNTLYMSNAANGLLNFRIGGTNAADGNTFHNLARLTTLAGVVQVDAAGGTGATPAGGSINGFIQNNTIFNDAGFTNGRRAIDIQVEADSHNLGAIAVDISNNTINNVAKQGISITVVSVGGGSATNTNFTITNNSIGATSPVGTEGNVDSGSAIEIETNFDTFSTGADIVVNALIQGNTFINNNSAGTVGSTFDVTNRGGDAGTTSVMNMTVLGNTITNQNGAGHVMVIRSSGGGTGAGGTVNLDMNSANTTPNNTTLGASAAGEIQLNQTVGAFNIENLGANPVDAFVSARNSGDTVTHSGTIGSTGAVTMPTAPTNFIIATPPPPPAPPAETSKGTGDGTGGDFMPPSPPPADPPVTPPSDQPVVVDDGILSQAELNLIVSAAIDRWAAAGATAEEIAAMRAVTFSVEDLAGLSLGASSAGHITIDSNAAGFSWFIDATPGDDGEYSGTGTRLTAAPDSQAGVRIDLLTTIMHELGHQIGLADDYGADERDELMYGTINPGERRLPGNDDLTGASGASLTGTAFALSPISIGTVPAGRTVTIQWDSTVNAFTNQIVPTFNNTSSISGSNFVTVTSNTEVLGPTSAPIALDSLTLGNLVFADVNANGVFDGGDTGINGVALTLFADTNANGVFDSGIDVQLATTTTAGGGLYSFANLAPGDYIVRVDAANFTGGGVLVNKLTASGGSDPDDNTDNDDNGVNGAGGIVVSQAITLTQDGEPTADGTGKFDINNTLDFGFINPNQPPVFTGLDGTPTFTEGAAAVALDSNATVSDPNLTATNYSGATLTLARSGGAQAQDVFGTTGTLSFSGSDVLVGATTVGTFTQSGGTLTITFNTNATQALVDSTLQQITYSNSSDNPPSSAAIAYVFNDGNSGAQGSGGALSANGSVTVSITPTNDAPTAILSNHNLGPATEQVAFDLKNSGLSVGDIDGNSGSETVTLAVGQGVLTVTAGTSGAGVSGSGTDTVTITGTIAQINALLNTDGTSTVSYTNGSDAPPASTSLTLTIHDNGNTGGGDLNASDSGTISISAVNDAPAFTGLDGTPSFTEGAAAVVLDGNATVSDPDLTATNYDGATLTLARSGGASAQDVFGASGTLAFTGVGSGNVDVGATTVGTYTQSGGTLVITFNGNATQALVDSSLQQLTYSNNSDNPPASAVIAYAFSDGNAGAQGSGGALTASGSVTVSITGADDPAVAVNDPGNATNENATVNIAVLANDSDPDGPPPSVAKVNGTTISVGSPVTLGSGAIVSLNIDGTLTYDPNHKFDTLTSTASGETGAVNTSAPDSFTYTLAGTGGGTATVSITVNGVVSIQDHLEGDSGDNVITGTPNGDYFDLSQGGNDTASGLGANDGFFFGAAFTAADTVDGGAGNNDQIGLQGDYTGANALTLGANTIANIEAIVVLPGYSYDITTDNGNVAAGGVLKVQATPLGAGENLTFNGSAETDGSFLVYGGLGNDTMTGGAGNDGFYFGPGGFNSGDTINGGGGSNDQLALDGNYGAFGPAFVLGGNVTNVEVVVLLPGPSGSPNTFNLTTADALVPAGQTMTIFGVQVATNIIFDGSNEHDGAFRIYGGSGNDIFTGGTGNDWIFGGYGGDQLTGGAGSDTFYYDDAAQSTSLGFDTIFGFDDSADTIDLPFAVTGLAAPASGNLSNATFDADLSTAFAGLTSHQAGMFTATGGDMNGRTFLVIDADGNAGYQAGSDYVMEIASPVTPIDNAAIFV